MPWSEAQIRLFRAAAHNPQIAASHGMTQAKAGQMAAEGVKPAKPKASPQQYAKALGAMR